MAKQQFTYALVVVMLAIGQINCELPAGFEQCDDNGAIIKSFQVSGCEAGPPCKVGAGKVTFEVDFTTAVSFVEMDLHVDVTNSHYSRRICSRCPTDVNQRREYSTNIEDVTSELPLALESDTMKFSLKDGDLTFVCVKFPVEILGGKKESDFVDSLVGQFEIRRPGGRKIPKELADKISGRQTIWPSGKKLPKELAAELAGTQVTFTF